MEAASADGAPAAGEIGEVAGIGGVDVDDLFGHRAGGLIVGIVIDVPIGVLGPDQTAEGVVDLGGGIVRPRDHSRSDDPFIVVRGGMRQSRYVSV